MIMIMTECDIQNTQIVMVVDNYYNDADQWSIIMMIIMMIPINDQ